MPRRYIPVLRWKRGERVGLRNLSAAGKANVVPLVLVAADQFRGRQPTISKGAVTAAENFVQELMTAWGTAPIYVDASAVPHSLASSPITDIAAAAQTVGATVVPATQLDAPPAYQQAVLQVAQTYGAGVGLRVDLQELTSAASWAGAWPHPLGSTDLIVDFADNVAAVYSLGAALDPAFMTVYAAPQWRTITMVGSSMPGNFSGYNAGLFTLPRIEWALWQRLATLPLPYILHYGDYTTVSPNAAPQGIAWGFPINVRYTLVNDFLVCRGVRTTGFGGVDMDQQLLGHAQSIVGWPTRGPLANVWGDTKIDDIAATTDTPGNLETWVQIGVNRHIERTRQSLP